MKNMEEKIEKAMVLITEDEALGSRLKTYKRLSKRLSS